MIKFVLFIFNLSWEDNPPIENITQEVVDKFIIERSKEGRKSKNVTLKINWLTLNRRGAYIYDMVEYSKNRWRVEKGIMKPVKIKDSKQSWYCPTTKEIEDIENEIEKNWNTSEIMKLRDSIVIKLLYQWWCRPWEVQRILVENYHPRLGKIRLLGKWNKRGEIFLTDELIWLINKWLKTRNVQSEYLICSLWKDFWWQVRRWFANELVEKYRKLAKIENHICWHSLRHYFWTYHHKKWTDVFTLQALMRHKDIKSTQIYVQVSDEEKLEALK